MNENNAHLLDVFLSFCRLFTQRELDAQGFTVTPTDKFCELFEFPGNAESIKAVPIWVKLSQVISKIYVASASKSDFEGLRSSGVLPKRNSYFIVPTVKPNLEEKALPIASTMMNDSFTVLRSDSADDGS